MFDRNPTELLQIIDLILEGSGLEGMIVPKERKGRRRNLVSSGIFWHADHIVPVIEGGGLQGENGPCENTRRLACFLTYGLSGAC